MFCVNDVFTTTQQFLVMKSSVSLMTDAPTSQESREYRTTQVMAMIRLTTKKKYIWWGKAVQRRGAQERHRCYYLLTRLCARQCIRHLIPFFITFIHCL